MKITSETRAAVPVSLSYDAYGRLTSYVASTATMTMRYSGTDERVKSVAGSVARRFAVDESQRTIGEKRPRSRELRGTILHGLGSSLWEITE
jgi:YD repeat-containing protein